MPFFTRKADQPAHLYRTAIIDIGSNSVRLVVYSGPRRNPAIIFNEKVMAGLGRALSETGAIDPEAMQRALEALRRFGLLAREMDVDETICVATAAVRDASNGEEFSRAVRDLGLELTILSGHDEALIAGMGVLSAIPDARGIVGDLGGGSLDMTRLADNAVHDSASFPMGVLRAAAYRKRGELAKVFAGQMKRHAWLADHPGQPLYLVGGSWRALARLDMHLTGYPLPVLHHYSMTPDRLDVLERFIDTTEREDWRSIPSVPSSRIDYLADALALLRMVSDHAGSSEFVVSAYGLREGLLYRAMAPDVRRRDPLLSATRQFGQMHSRYGNDGDRLYQWIAPIFQDDPPEWARWLHAACYLADTGWQANPDFRAERGLETALHGNWVGIDAPGRVMIAQALFSNLGGGARTFDPTIAIADTAMMNRAMCWGLAIRLGLRLGAGTQDIYDHARLSLKNGRLELEIAPAYRALMGEVVDRRLRKLAQALQSDYVLLAA